MQPIILEANESLWDVLIAVGTILAVLAALGTAWWAGRIAEADRREADRRAAEDRKDANDRAAEDRAAAAERDRLHRKHATLAVRLDHLVKIAEALEAYESTKRAMWASDAEKQRETVRMAGVLRARVDASPDRLLAVEAVYGQSRPTPAYVNKIYQACVQQHPDLIPFAEREKPVYELQNANPIVLARMEIYARIREVRSVMQIDPIPQI